MLKLLYWSAFVACGTALPAIPESEDGAIRFASEADGDSNPSFQYNTAQAKTQIPNCQGPCEKSGKNYEWCTVSGGMSEWDFCSSEIKTNVVAKDFSVTKGPCKGPCYHKNDELIDDFWCEVYWGGEDKCIQEKHSYVQAKTVYGLDCVGACKKHDSAKYFWCYDTNRSKSYCALPGRIIAN